MASEQNESYRVVLQGGQGEIVEKKSRFIATVRSVETEQEAAAFIEEMKKKYWDARHNCSALVIGSRGELTRCSDDGEPSGTAGKPILEVLLGAEVTDVAIVVTRYFGGTLLGTGGLVRSYTQAAQAGLADAGIATMCYGKKITIRAEYSDVGKLQYLLGSREIDIQASRYTDTVEFDIRIPADQCREVEKALTEATAGRVGIAITGEGYYRTMDKREV